MSSDPQASVDPPSQQILTPLTEAAIFLVLTVAPGGEQIVRDLLADVSGLKRSVGFRIPEGELVCVTGIGAQLWDRLFGNAVPRPAELHPFPGFRGAKHTAPATPGDLLFHIRAHRLDLCFELAGRLVDRLAAVTTVVDEVHGFRSFDERDLLGFVDGTENPEGQAAVEAVTISGSPFAGGSYVIVQKYLHDLTAWNALSVEQQERVIGRTKLDDIELADEVKPADSHVALNTIEDEDGVQQQIMRFNMPFGHVGAGEFGTYFIGYAKTAALIEQMLTNMFVGNPVGTYDRVLDFSTAVTGNLFFVPDADFLDDPPAPVAPAQAAIDQPTDNDRDDPERTDAASDGSLRIGNLREDRR